MGENDQIIKIFSRFKRINEEQDFSFVSCDDSLGYLKQVTKLAECKKDLKDSFSHNSPELVQILTQMLEINPYFRPSANQLLKNPIFDEIRINKNEKPPPFRVKIEVDKGHYAQNYEDQSRTQVEMNKLLKMIIKEANKIKVS